MIGSGKLAVIGYVSKSSGGTELFIGCYSTSNGNEEWRMDKTAMVDTEKSKGFALTVGANNEITLLGTEEINNQKAMLLIGLTDNGSTSWEKYFNHSLDCIANTILTRNNSFYAFGGMDEVGFKSTINKFEVKARDLTPTLNSSGEPIYLTNSMIIRFNKSSLNLSAIDNLEFTAGEIEQFINQEVISEMTEKTGYDWKGLNTYKIHRRATSSITESITRLGDTIDLPEFWASLLVDIPAGSDVLVMADSLSSVNGIKYGSPDKLSKYYAVPNDGLYTAGSQLGLHPNNTYPNAHIDVEGAWDFEIGKNYVKVGVFDEVIDWSHVDFGSAGTLSGSKITGGHNYFNNTNLSTANNIVGGHGTAVAGIIGAQRNDGIGIAGIAGGDVLVDPTNLRGVQLFSMGISESNSFAIESVRASAIHEGATNWSTYGYGLHLQNHSYGNTYAPSLDIGEAVKVAWRNHCVFIAAMGYANSSGGGTMSWPACYPDKQVLSVIASGNNGAKKTAGNGANSWASSGPVIPTITNSPDCYPDFMAPGTIELVSTTLNNANAHTADALCLTATTNSGGDYRCFEGTSAAAPHVTGVAALMYSKHVPINGHQNALAPEDIENILQKTATQLNGSVGYDNINTAHGKIHARNALEQVTLPYTVMQRRHKIATGTTTLQGTWSNIPVLDENNAWTTYDQVKKYKISWTVNETLGASDQIIDWWEVEGGILKGGSNFYNGGILTYGGAYLNANLTIPLNGNTVSGTIEMVFYELMDNGIVTDYPRNRNKLQYMYSLHVLRPGTLSTDSENNLEFTLFPNPSDDLITLTFDEGAAIESDVTIYDLTGRVMLQTTAGSNNTSIVFDISKFESGMYFCTVTSDDKKSTKKFIKQ